MGRFIDLGGKRFNRLLVVSREKMEIGSKQDGFANVIVEKSFFVMHKQLQQDIDYRRYGERGIKVCLEWKNDFMSFYDWSMANGWKQDLVIDRINNDGNYKPSNCQWITSSENLKKYWREWRQKNKK